MSCHFQDEGQGKNEIYECQWYPLLQLHFDILDADNHQTENCTVTKHPLYSGTGIRVLAIVISIFLRSH